MVHVLEPTKVLFTPFDAVASFVERRRWVVPLLLFIFSAAFAAAAYGVRWNAAPTTLKALEKSGALTSTTEVDLAKAIVTAGRVRLVTGVLGAVFVSPTLLLLFAGVLKVTAWLLSAKAKFMAAFTAVTAATLPLSLRQLIFSLSALRQPSLPDGAEHTLVPSNLGALVSAASAPVMQVLRAVDFFSLWSVGLLALGFSAAAGLRRSRALVAVTVLYVLYIGVFMIGLPALAPQGGLRP
ncbi:MAG: YIP1 family protein [Myxococcaceae bacterium]